MTQFINNNVASGDIVKASDHNDQGALLANVINGNLDSGNVKDKGLSLGDLNGGTTDGVLVSDVSGNVTSQKLTADKIDFTTILLGRITPIITNQLNITTEVDITGSTLSITIPAGREVRFFWSIPLLSVSVSGDRAAVALKRGATTHIVWSQVRQFTLGSIMSGETLIRGLSGPNTFRLTIQREIGSGNVSTNADATHPIEFYAEVVG